MLEGFKAFFHGLLQHSVGPAVVVFDIEVIDIVETGPFQAGVYQGDDILQIVVVLQKAVIQKYQVLPVGGEGVFFGNSRIQGPGEENGLGKGCPNGVAGRIPTSVGDEAMQRKLFPKKLWEQRLFCAEMLAEINEGYLFSAGDVSLNPLDAGGTAASTRACPSGRRPAPGGVGRAG